MEPPVDTNPEHPRPRGRQALIHNIDIMGGLCLACILTLAFMSPLNSTAKWSLCIFATALPVFALMRVALRQESVAKTAWFHHLSVTAILIAAIGLVLLVWSVYWLAGVLIVTSGVAIFVVLFATSLQSASTQE